MKISQSLHKDMQSYLDGNECGKVIEFKHVQGKLIPAEGVMLQGQFFEFIATGGLPKDGKIPKPEYLKVKKKLWDRSEVLEYLSLGTLPGKIKNPPAGLENRQEFNIPSFDLEIVMEIHKNAVNVQSMTAEYRRAWEQAQEFKRQCDEIGIEILGVQQTGERDGITGVRDIHFRWTKGKRKGKEGTIDLKYSGLINNDYEVYGWGFRDFDSMKIAHLRQMNNHKIQAIQYDYIFDQPFFYWVFSSATGAEDTGENIFLEMSYDDFELEQHLKKSESLYKEFEFYKGIGFEARPGYNKCRQCPFAKICEDKQVINEPVLVKIVSE